MFSYYGHTCTCKNMRGGSLQVAMDNFEIDKVLKNENISHRIITYDQINQIDPLICPNWIIFLSYPGSRIGHWTCLLFYRDGSRKMLFFDPYAFGPDEEWNYLDNPLHYKAPPPVLSTVVLPRLKRRGWILEVNPYDIQGALTLDDRAERFISRNLCGELVSLRIIYKKMSSREFYEYIVNDFTPERIYEIIKYIHDGKFTTP
jgi:hypothetical protein